MINRTPWKKSRKYGDVLGGRKFPKLTEKIFNRLHSLDRPGVNDELPILIQENPSRDFFFPVSAEEIQAKLETLAQGHGEGITHIWLHTTWTGTGDTGAKRIASRWRTMQISTPCNTTSRKRG